MSVCLPVQKLNQYRIGSFSYICTPDLTTVYHSLVIPHADSNINAIIILCINAKNYTKFYIYNYIIKLKLNILLYKNYKIIWVFIINNYLSGHNYLAYTN
jgi:hypothetical protein